MNKFEIFMTDRSVENALSAEERITKLNIANDTICSLETAELNYHFRAFDDEEEQQKYFELPEIKKIREELANGTYLQRLLSDNEKDFIKYCELNSIPREDMFWVLNNFDPSKFNVDEINKIIHAKNHQTDNQ